MIGSLSVFLLSLTLRRGLSRTNQRGQDSLHDRRWFGLIDRRKIWGRFIRCANVSGDCVEAGCWRR